MEGCGLIQALIVYVEGLQVVPATATSWHCYVEDLRIFYCEFAMYHVSKHRTRA